MAYVWDVYNVNTTYAETKKREVVLVFAISYTMYLGKSYTFNSSTGKYTVTSSVMTLAPSDWVDDDGIQTPGKYFGDHDYMIRSSQSGTPMYSDHTGISGGSIVCTYTHTATANTSKGTISTTATSDSASAYPQDAVSGSNWYTFRGAPSGISYPDKIEAGQAVQITWSAGTNPLYYRVERSTDGGKSWVVLSATVTATSFTDTSIAGDTSSPSVMYRVCTLGEMAVSDYSTGGEVGIPRCSVRIKAGGQWLKGKATYRKENGAWIIIPMADEAAVFGADTHRNVILLSS